MTKKTKILIPSTGPEDWQALLSDPEKHWVTGRSAKTLAHCWEGAKGFPPEVRRIFKKSSHLREIKPLLIFPEWKVQLPGGGHPSQSDIWIVARTLNGLVSITIEGVIDERFDKTLEEWKRKAKNDAQKLNRQKRLEDLVDYLGLNDEPPGHIRYQLMHRTASAIIEAERFDAKAAVMLIHTFSPEDRLFEDYREFCKLFRIEAEKGVLAETTARNELPLYLGWVHGDESYRQR